MTVYLAVRCRATAPQVSLSAVKPCTSTSGSPVPPTRYGKDWPFTSTVLACSPATRRKALRSQRATARGASRFRPTATPHRATSTAARPTITVNTMKTLFSIEFQAQSSGGPSGICLSSSLFYSNQRIAWRRSAAQPLRALQDDASIREVLLRQFLLFDPKVQQAAVAPHGTQPVVGVFTVKLQ